MQEPEPQAGSLPHIKQAIGSLTLTDRRELAAWLRQQDRPVKPSRSLAPWRSVAGTLLGLLAFMAVEGAIFRSGWYTKYLEPNSTTGQVEYNLFWLRRMWPPKVPDVLVVGDSRIAEGFSARAASAAAGDQIHFTSLGMPGSSPRVWYFTLRDMERDRNRFSAIVIALDHYSDRDSTEAVQDRATDLNYLAGRLRLTDCPDFARSFRNADVQRSVLTGCLIRGIAYRADVLAFLSDIPGRLKRTKDWRNNGAGYVAGYGGKPEDLTGLTMDEATRTIHFPPGVKDWQINAVRGTLTPDPAAQTGALTAYRSKWIGGILDLYKNSATRIVFIQLPNAPLPVPEPAEPARFLQSVTSRPNLTVFPPDSFRDLQRPDLFADGLHLNHTGRKIFSEKLAQAVKAVVH